jgi:hypothetical protein
VIVRGKPEESELIRRVKSTDPDGVEIGQLGVIAAVAVLAAVLRKQLAVIHEPDGWRRHVVVPATLAIAFTGAFWTVQRLAAVLGAG